MADRDSDAKDRELEARLTAIEALIQQTLLRVAPVSHPGYGDIIEGTVDQISETLALQMSQNPEVCEQAERVLAPVRAMAAKARSRRAIHASYRDFDD
jgi:hypothetical protein